MVIATTERLILRQFESADAEAMLGVFGDAEVMRFGSGVKERAWIDAWMERMSESYRVRGFGLWAVVDRVSGAVLGYCGLHYFPDIGGQPEIEIGYRLARRYWGRGYATEAARAVREHAFDVLKLPRLISLIDPGNVASIRVAEKNGMIYEKDVTLQGYTHADRVYAISRPDGGGL